MGFGATGRQIHTFKIRRLSEDLPVTIELVDTREKLENFLDFIDDKIDAGLVTLEKAEVRFYRGKKKKMIPAGFSCGCVLSDWL